jgi:hypothetical protein
MKREREPGPPAAESVVETTARPVPDDGVEKIRRAMAAT